VRKNLRLSKVRGTKLFLIIVTAFLFLDKAMSFASNQNAILRMRISLTLARPTTLPTEFLSILLKPSPLWLGSKTSR